ncbi:MAG: tetratricopeptide repeat protein [Gemmatimonadota bacterium]|nr:tetratricopeptide repeat protein [Gemmatimonadota bacterium]
MIRQNLKSIEAVVESLEKGRIRGQASLIETIGNVITALEQELGFRARPPRKRVSALAERLASKLESLIPNQGNKLDPRFLHNCLSRLYQAMLQREKQLCHARAFHELLPPDAPLTECADSWIFLAKACYWSDDQQGAVDYQRRALDLLDQARERGKLSEEDEKGYNPAYTVWAFRYSQNTCAWERADETFNWALGRARAWNDSGALCSALLLYAESMMFRGDWERCERLGDQCVQAALALPGGPDSDYPFWIWGRALVHTGRAEKALPVLGQAVDLAENIGDAVGLSEALASQAEAFLALGRNEDALAVAAKSLRVAKYAGLGVNLAQVKVWQAWIEMQIDSSSALRNLAPLHQSLADFEKAGMRSGWACACAALGHALLLSGRREMAGHYLERALQAFHEWNMPWHEERTRASMKLPAR